MLGALLLATTITVTPNDSFDKIENAQPGDEVVIAPGTYHFRVYLTKAGSAPIVIRAMDPANPPVWDMGTTLVENAPGSYTAGDRGRGCWQVVGGTNYTIESIVFTHCRTASNNSAGIRYWGGTHNLLIRNCVFRENDNGITGGNADSDATVEFSEFDRNGNTAASSSAPTHNLYIYGGVFTLRYSYVHDPVQAQNFHIRATNGTIEYNWIARGASYEGDLMTSDDFVAGGGPYTQTLLLRGNVILQNGSPNNRGQMIAVYNDGGIAGVTMNVKLYGNTIVGAGTNAAVVHLSNADSTMMTGELVNNILSGTMRASLIETPAVGTISGTNNWMAAGADATGLLATVFSASPGFNNASNKDYTLMTGSAAIGHAAQNANAPVKEYFRDETLTRMYRVRASANDIGAFESTTSGPGIGPNGMAPDGGGGSGGTGGQGGVIGSGGTNGTNPQGSADNGCGCMVGAAAGSIGGVALLVVLIVMLRRKISR